MTYNGWTNKETWLVNLWLGDGLPEMIDPTDSLSDIEDRIKELVEMITDEVTQAGLLADLLNCALGEINYRELAEHYKEDSE